MWKLVLIAAGTIAAQAAPLFQDNFGVPGTHLDLAAWTTEMGPAAVLGRTQLADWVTPGSPGQFVVGNDGARLALRTFNPMGNAAIPLFYGTHAKTIRWFQPTRATTVVLTARLQLTSLQPGIVYGIYFYECPAERCAGQHDEIDIELVANRLQRWATPLKVELNRYAAEPLGGGHGAFVNLPPGFDPLAPHDWTIRWSFSRIDYLVDGTPLSSEATHIPQGPMQVNVIAWAPGPEWADAFSAALEPAAIAAMDQSFVALLTSVTVASSRRPPARRGRLH